MAEENKVLEGMIERLRKNEVDCGEVVMRRKKRAEVVGGGWVVEEEEGNVVIGDVIYRIVGEYEKVGWWYVEKVVMGGGMGERIGG
ncbi:hypothetical protein, partial [Corynebacterium glyciniphilum]|uniref:hypothetical protein n=1 Tax=Corynebacterium glyciniphilum TaxID=1404244 RepID=UPI0011AB6347